MNRAKTLLTMAALLAGLGVGFVIGRASALRYQILHDQRNIVRLNRATGETVVARARSGDQWERILELDSECVLLTDSEKAFLGLKQSGMSAERVRKFASYGYSEWVKEHDPADTPLMVRSTPESRERGRRLGEQYQQLRDRQNP